MKKANKNNVIKSYLRETRDPLYSAIMVVPLLVIYSFGVLSLDISQLNWENLNGVDFITPLLFRHFGTQGVLIFNGVALLLAALAAAYLKRGKRELKLELIAPMLIESLIYAFFLGGLIIAVMHRVAPFTLALPSLSYDTAFDSLGPIQKLTLSCGAGLFEELVFRLILLGTTQQILSRVFELGPKRSWIFSLLGTSVLFSLVHYLGPESFQLYSFVFRTLAGIAFALLFWLRGFAIAAWTHALYDVLVLFGG